MQSQLKYLQLYRGGFPICPQTVAAKLDIDNYGEAPGTTEYEKWLWWKKQEVMVQVQGQLLAAQAMAAAGLMPPQPGGGGPPQEPPAAPPQPQGPNQPHPGGRPPSGKKPPHLAEKGQNSWQPRTTIEES